MKIAVILVLLISQIAFAKQAPQSTKKSRKIAQDTRIKVTPLNRDWPEEELDSSRYDIQTDADNPIQEVVSPELRDAALVRSGVMKYVSKWDHLDKDMLLLRLKHKPFAAVQKIYPKIPANALMKLKKELQ